MHKTAPGSSWKIFIKNNHADCVIFFGVENILLNSSIFFEFEIRNLPSNIVTDFKAIKVIKIWQEKSQGSYKANSKKSFVSNYMNCEEDRLEIFSVGVKNAKISNDDE